MSMDYKRGELITTLPSLAQELGFSVQNIRTALKHLEMTGEISERKTNRYRIIKVNNYDKYQASVQQTEAASDAFDANGLGV